MRAYRLKCKNGLVQYTKEPIWADSPAQALLQTEKEGLIMRGLNAEFVITEIQAGSFTTEKRIVQYL